MKNIHVLPTDKPSRLAIYDGRLLIAKGIQYGSDYIANQSIYITSNEEIKVGDWFICNNIIKKCKWSAVANSVKYFVDDLGNQDVIDFCKKIILTTDTDLIDNGVQAIDDEFLEWFVNNPSCEEVGVEIIYNCEEIGNCIFDSYKIIIPKEEPCECTDECLGYLTKTCKRIEEPKQETLEELPTNLEPVLAKITHQNDLGLSQWYEVVYYDIDDSKYSKWCCYSGSKTFQDGERVVAWKYCKDLI